MINFRQNIYLGLTSVSFLWGTSFAAAKIGMYDLLPLNLVILRFIIASSIFAGILYFMKENNKIERHDIPRFILLGFLAITSYFYIQFTGLQHTTTINAALIIAISPICTLIFSVLLGWEKINWPSTIGIVTSFIGVASIITKGRFDGIFHSDTIIGDLLLLTNAIVWAGFTVYGKSILAKYRPFVAMAYIHLFGTLLLLPLAFIPTGLAPTPLTVQLAHISGKTVTATLYLALLCSVYAYYTWYTGVERIGAIRTSVFSYFNPLFAVTAGILLMNEEISFYTALGGILVIAGVYWTNNNMVKPASPNANQNEKG